MLHLQEKIVKNGFPMLITIGENVHLEWIDSQYGYWDIYIHSNGKTEFFLDATPPPMDAISKTILNKMIDGYYSVVA